MKGRKAGVFGGGLLGARAQAALLFALFRDPTHAGLRRLAHIRGSQCIT